MAEKFTRWDTAEELRSDEDIAGFLEAALEEDDPAFFAHALGIAARARGMSQVARDAGVTREGLYKALSADGNPEFATIFKVARVLGMRLHVKAA